MTEKHEFEAKDGTVYEFSTEEERDAFGVEYAIGNLVAEGYGEIVTVDGEQAFRINDRGRAHLAEQEKLLAESADRSKAN